MNRRLHPVAAICHLLLLLLLQPPDPCFGIRRRPGGRKRTELSCEERLDSISLRMSTPVYPLNMKGVWVSRRCEVRPGPEFIVRRYHFTSNTRFRIFQYYYSDPQCTVPFYTLSAEGYIDKESHHRSLLIAGTSTYNRPKIKRVTVFPYTSRAALYLQNNAAGATHEHCNRIGSEPEWRAKETHILLNLITHGKRASVDIDCTDKLGFNLNELQLIRQDQIRRPRHLNDRELFLGAVSTEFGSRASHRPSNFQDVLLDVTHSKCDATCQKIRHATMKNPPVLSSPQPLHSTPYGRWVSVECESQSQGRFLTRLLRFNHRNNTWEGDYFNFYDHRCRRPTYNIFARGNFYKKNKSPSNSDSISYDFFINRLIITPKDDKTLMLLNSYRGTSCGYPGEWMLDTPQDVSDTGGCGLLGLYVPEVKQQTLKLELDYKTNLRQLFVGQLPNTYVDGISQSRPTAFQGPLVECRPASELEPTYSAVDSGVISPPKSSGTVLTTARTTGYRNVGVTLSTRWSFWQKLPLVLGAFWMIGM